MIVDPDNPGGEGLASGASRTAGWWTRLSWVRRLKWWVYVVIPLLVYFEYMVWDDSKGLFAKALGMWTTCSGSGCIDAAGAMLKGVLFHGSVVLLIIVAMVEEYVLVRDVLLLAGSILYAPFWHMAVPSRFRIAFYLSACLMYFASTHIQSDALYFGMCALSFLLMLLRLTLFRRRDPMVATFRSGWSEFFFGKPSPAAQPRKNETSPLA